jgi:predicted NBD/HSP70 family sugar kinase
MHGKEQNEIIRIGMDLARRDRDTPRGDCAATIGEIVGLIQQVEAETGRRGSVGVGIPGVPSTATGFIRNASSTWLNGRPLDRGATRVVRTRHGNSSGVFGAARLGRPEELSSALVAAS